jgi:EAL domain-containing protein (putative c-di-GMP-specific phosphodiesterase class I)
VIAARDRPQADLLAARILAAMAAPVQVAAGRFPLRCSVGYALATGGTNRQRLDVLLRSALRAAHQAGAALGGACAVCADDMPGSVRTDQQQLTEQMVAAVGAGRIEVVHRPLTELDGGALVGLTSVAMWLDPAGERHMTVGGFPQRARMDLLAQQLLHSLEFVARGRYDARLPETVGVTLSVAAVHLADRSLVDVVDEACRRTGLPPSTFTFEIDEADLLPNEESLATGLEALVERGVQLGVSRFGETRGVSLNRLRGFPVSTVSLSEVLTAGIGQSSNRRFVRAVVAAGRELGFTVWAPLPADTPELRRALAAAGVRWVESGATVHAG